MEIEQSSLYREVETILNSQTKPVNYYWTAQIHANGETYDALKVLSVDFVRDFELNYADEIMVRLMILGGTYAKRIYPFQSNLEITMIRTPLVEGTDSASEQVTRQSERYTATMVDKGDPMLEGNGGNSATEAVLNTTNMFEIDFQLVNKSLEQLRMISIGGVYRYTTGEDVIKAVLTAESRKVKVEGVRMPQGVDMIPSTNQTKRDHLVIPQGTLLVNLPEYIQQKCGGVYGAGMGYYLQGDFWYLYPCYDVQRFNKAPKTLTIINVPKNKFPGVERTYRLDGNNLVILATGSVSLSDDSDAQQLNAGNGVRFADASKFMGDYAQTSNNKTTISRGANNNEFVSTPRENANNNVRNSTNPINSNPYQEYSKLARREGSFLLLNWENSCPELIFPGMMVRVMYLKEDEIKQVDGVMLKAHDISQIRGEAMTANRHTSQTALAIFVQRKPA